MTNKFYVEAHIPRGSGDAEYRIYRYDGVIVAIIDPDMAFDNSCAIAERICDAMNINPDAII